MADLDCAVLGQGTIGSLLVRQLLQGGNARSITVANRSPGRFAVPEGVGVADFETAVRGADVVFLCVKPIACAPVLEALTTRTALLVCCAADVSEAQLRTRWTGPLVRMMPVVTSAWGRGTTLLGRSGDTDPEALALVQGLFPTLTFLSVPAEHWNAVSAITSCGPGLLAALLQQFARSSPACGLDPRVVEGLVLESMAGVLAWTATEGRPLSDLLQAVASPGGVTGEGARVLQAALPPVFEAMHQAMDQRHSQRQAAVDASFFPKRE